jgi:hypothetical protein
MAGANASAGSGGSSAPRPRMPRADLDPAVRFDWDESAPTNSSACMPGKYVGTFQCMYIIDAMNPDLFAVLVQGPIELHLERSADGEFLEIRDGMLFGVAEEVFGFTAKLSGRLDCASLQLQAMALDGVYGFGDPAVFPVGTFAGTLGGTLDGATGMMTGSWQLGVDMGGTCNGPWMASFMP